MKTGGNFPVNLNINDEVDINLSKKTTVEETSPLVSLSKGHRLEISSLIKRPKLKHMYLRTTGKSYRYSWTQHSCLNLNQSFPDYHPLLLVHWTHNPIEIKTPPQPLHHVTSHLTRRVRSCGTRHGNTQQSVRTYDFPTPRTLTDPERSVEEMTVVPQQI